MHTLEPRTFVLPMSSSYLLYKFKMDDQIALHCWDKNGNFELFKQFLRKPHFLKFWVVVDLYYTNRPYHKIPNLIKYQVFLEAIIQSFFNLGVQNVYTTKIASTKVLISEQKKYKSSNITWLNKTKWYHNIPHKTKLNTTKWVKYKSKAAD